MVGPSLGPSKQVVLAGLVLSFFVQWEQRTDLVFSSPGADNGVEAVEQDFLGAALPEGLPESAVSPHLGPALWPCSHCPALPARAQQEPSTAGKSAGRFQRLTAHPWVSARPWWREPPGSRMIKWVVIGCPRTDSNYTFIYIALCLQRARRSFIHLFFFKTKFVEFLSDNKSKAYS